MLNEDDRENGYGNSKWDTLRKTIITSAHEMITKPEEIINGRLIRFST